MIPTTNFTNYHGVFLDIYDSGVLLTGDSGIGKSEVALNLIDRGHKLIADDCVEFRQSDDDNVIGSCPELLIDFIEVRGLGILNVRNMYGDHSVVREKKLNFMVHLFQVQHADLKQVDRLRGMYREKMVLDHAIPEVSIPVAPGRNLSILVEAGVRNLQLKQSGYDSSQDFHFRQRQLIEEGHCDG